MNPMQGGLESLFYFLDQYHSTTGRQRLDSRQHMKEAGRDLYHGMLEADRPPTLDGVQEILDRVKAQREREMSHQEARDRREARAAKRRAER